MKRIIENLKAAGVVIAVVAVIALIFWANFKVWRLQHPDAPGWTYIFKGK